MMDLKNKTIGVVMGGESAEREVSLNSGRPVAKALLSRGYQVKEVVVDAMVAEQIQKAGIDVAFIALHGGWGEDGRLQALCEMLKVTYTGSGVGASALAMNKSHSKAIFLQHGIPTPKYCPALSRQFVFETMKFTPPLVIKPNTEGSTVGISIVRREDEFEAALYKAREYDETPMAEVFIEGRELTVGVLSGEPLGVVEIIPEGGFYDYAHKYTSGASRYVAPAEIPAELTSRLREIAARTYAALGCRGGARVDFRLDLWQNPFVLEINTIPGMTPLSLLPKSAAVMGMSYEDLCEKMLINAVEGK